MYRKLAYLLLLSFIILQSCQKEIAEREGEPTIPPNPTDSINVVDSNYIDKIYAIDSSGGNVDTFIIWSYKYDSKKRVISMSIMPTNPADKSNLNFYYNYANNDTLPFKTVKQEEEYMDQNNTILGSDTITTFHFFDALGRNSKDSVIRKNKSMNYYTIKNYTYGLNRIYRADVSHSVDNVTYYAAPPAELDTAITDNNGNILSTRLYRYNESASTWEFTIKTNFTYDNKKSPFANLSNFKTFHVFPNGETLIYELPQTNNPLTQEEHPDLINGYVPVSLNFSYLYRPDGKIITTKSYEANTAVPEAILKFTYKDL